MLFAICTTSIHYQPISSCKQLYALHLHCAGFRLRYIFVRKAAYSLPASELGEPACCFGLQAKKILILIFKVIFFTLVIVTFLCQLFKGSNFIIWHKKAPT